MLGPSCLEHCGSDSIFWEDLMQRPSNAGQRQVPLASLGDLLNGPDYPIDDMAPVIAGAKSRNVGGSNGSDL